MDLFPVFIFACILLSVAVWTFLAAKATREEFWGLVSMLFACITSTFVLYALIIFYGLWALALIPLIGLQYLFYRLARPRARPRNPNNYRVGGVL